MILHCCIFCIVYITEESSSLFLFITCFYFVYVCKLPAYDFHTFYFGQCSHLSLRFVSSLSCGSQSCPCVEIIFSVDNFGGFMFNLLRECESFVLLKEIFSKNWKQKSL